jgi:hypothetical protein
MLQRMLRKTVYDECSPEGEPVCQSIRPHLAQYGPQRVRAAPQEASKWNCANVPTNEVLECVGPDEKLRALMLCSGLTLQTARRGSGSSRYTRRPPGRLQSCLRPAQTECAGF